MLKIKSCSVLLAAGLFTALLQGCDSMPSVPYIAEISTNEVVNSWVEDLVADLGFGSMVSTRIGDAHPMVPWLEGLSNELKPVKGTSFDLQPGYYRFRIQSFCLEPGAHGPAASEGHLLAPLKGQRTRLVQSILARAGEHPEIPQRDIQRFLWGIDAGLTLPEFPDSVRSRISPLLTPQEALQLTIDGGEVASFIAGQFFPQEAQQIVLRYRQLRALLADVQTTYQALEQVAVQLGAAPPGPGSQQLAAGHWSYAGDGFYARTIPESYSTTVLEVVRPAPYRIERDELGRIVRFDSGSYRIEATYHDRTGPKVVRGPNGQEGHIWQFKRLKFTGPRRGDTHIVRNSGWIVAPEPTSDLLALFNHTESTDTGSHGSKRAYELAKNMYASNGLVLARADSTRQMDQRWADYYKRIKRTEKFTKDVIQYGDEWERATRSPDEQAVRDLTDLNHFRDGVKTAVKPTDLEGKGSWLRDHFGRLRNAWNYASCVLGGDCPPPGMEENPLRRPFDPSRGVSAPSNTSRQPLGLTRPFDPSRMVSAPSNTSRQPLGLTTRIVGR